MDQADAVVVGAGAIGSSIAYHLTALGQRVVLVDRFGVASQTSSRAAGLTAQIRGSELMTRLAIRSVELIERFAQETGEGLVFHQSGSLKIARTTRDEEQLRREVERARRLGLDVLPVSVDEARDLFPMLEGKGVRAITFTPSDLYLEPSQLPLGYARAAAGRGARVMTDTAVNGVVSRNGAVEGVVTSRGEIQTPVVVDAAGAWSGLIAGMLGQSLAFMPTRHQLAITTPVDGVADSLPIVRVVDTNVYIRPASGGLMIGGYEADPIQYDMRNLPADFQISDLELDLSVVRRLAYSVREQFPVLQEFEVSEHRGGLPTMTPDGEHIVGPVPRLRGFFLATGCCVGGLSISPAIGELLAHWIAYGESPLDITPLLPNRFFNGQWSDDWLRAESRYQYAHHYSDLGDGRR